ncbi:hypothetical protein KAZ66_06055 [Candidatus Woesebacteria bacterium]|nr:hypothetical protein [Candidatus Woesebacteria bacterium]
MDIDGYTFHKKFNEDRFREMCQKHWLYGEISYLFYSIFFAEDFFDFYREHFVTPHVKTYLDVLDHRMGVNIDKQERKNVEKVVAKPFYQEATRRVRKNVIPKKNLRSAKKYL